MSDYLVISCSLNPESNSRGMAHAVFESLKMHYDEDIKAELIDLRDVGLPICDGAGAYADPAVGPITAKVKAAKCIIMAVPIYNYDVNAAAKNFVELTGRAWQQKVVGFLCAAGGKLSYMSVMGLANSLMLDFRCLIIPRYVYAEDEHFSDAGEPSAKIQERLDELAKEAIRITTALHPSSAPAN